MKTYLYRASKVYHHFSGLSFKVEVNSGARQKTSFLAIFPSESVVAQSM